ncbi:hypothetical protein [Roseofilum casamattae]|uniref:Uncharacterized protein n=1 Tax=Roseofilum casamattae BLCC-M143 TaxID=3022442 RepID=A0ABT7C4Y6_9CYAN|nr:hypothetical protein [Roseofilum casamattae]MDJ1185873.1 hypothetical protein [Roseofilum casamattae BLCC-M143]
MAVKGKTREIPIFEASGIESQTLARLEQLLGVGASNKIAPNQQ